MIFLERSDIFIVSPYNTKYKIFDAQEIADKILKIFREKKIQKTLQNDNIKKKLDQYSWEKVFKKFGELLSI